MTSLEAQAIVRLIAHLDGTQVLDGADLAVEVAWLAEAAGGVNGVRVVVDEQALADTLSEVAQRFADGGAP